MENNNIIVLFEKAWLGGELSALRIKSASNIARGVRCLITACYVFLFDI